MNLTTQLRDLAGQEGNDSEEYDLMVEASYVIDRLQTGISVLSRNNRELYTHIREGLEEGDEKEYLQKTLYILAKHK